jgi:hypothetical protein
MVCWISIHVLEIRNASLSKRRNILYPEAEGSGILRDVETSLPSLPWITI